MNLGRVLLLLRILLWGTALLIVLAAISAGMYWYRYFNGPFYGQPAAKVVELARAVDARLTASASQGRSIKEIAGDEEAQMARFALRGVDEKSEKYAEAQELLKKMGKRNSVLGSQEKMRLERESADKAAKAEKEQKINLDKSSNQAFAMAMIKSRLRDPDSAVFGETNVYFDRKFKGAPVTAVCGRVNARNGFGGMTGMQEFVAMPKLGIATVNSPNDNGNFVSLWNALCAGKHT